MQETPSVSILLPTYNGARFIARAIDSVRAQSFKDWELIVIIDGSTDATSAIVNQYMAKDGRIKIAASQKNLGIQKSLNVGLGIANGELIARIDDDDEWTQVSKLEEQVEYLTTHPDCVLVGTGMIVVDESGKELYRFLNPLTDAEIRTQITYRNCFSHSTVLFKRSAAQAVGFYSEESTALHVEDYDLWLKMGKIGTFANLPRYSVRFTQRAKALSSLHKLAQLKKQLWITCNYQKIYPRFYRNRIKSYLRLILYTLLGPFIPAGIKSKLVELYKQ